MDLSPNDFTSNARTLASSSVQRRKIQELMKMLCSIQKRCFFAFVLLIYGVALFQGGTARAQPYSSAEPPDEKFSTISANDLAQMLPTKDFVLVNVHVPYEGHIARTDDFIPFDGITSDLGKLPTDRRASIILYCMSGRMSEIAAEALSEVGYSNVSHVAGGMIAWRADGHNILNNQPQR